ERAHVFARNGEHRAGSVTALRGGGVGGAASEQQRRRRRGGHEGAGKAPPASACRYHRSYPSEYFIDAEGMLVTGLPAQRTSEFAVGSRSRRACRRSCCPLSLR